jgi:C_GCAxxG_C_C family probable redox protein
MNCAQSILTAYADRLKFDPKFVLSVSSGFGGGMGKLQKTCGAVTESFMALGIYNSQKHFENIEARNVTNEMIQKYTIDFEAMHGSLDCKSFLDCDFTTDEGEEQFKDMDLKNNVCSKCLADSVKLIEGLIGEK